MNIPISKIFRKNVVKDKHGVDNYFGIVAGLILFSVTACQFGVSSVDQPQCSSLSPDMTKFTEARDRSQSIREQTDAPPPLELFRQVSQFRADYISLREIFFKQVFLNASGIVEKVESQNQYSVLFRTSQSLFAGTELIKNFHAAGSLINLHPSIREF